MSRKRSRIRQARRARERNAGRRTARNGWSRGGGRALRLSSFEVTEEPLPDPFYDRLSPADQKRFDAVLERFHNRPRRAMKDLEALLERFPKCRKLHTYLVVAYQDAGEHDRSRRLIEETHRKFPDYLFAIVNLARLRIVEGRLDEVPVLMKHRLCIDELYPGRRLFHISEVVAFQALVVEYLLCTGRIERAASHAGLIRRLAPDHPEARRLQAMLQELSAPV